MIFLLNYSLMHLICRLAILHIVITAKGYNGFLFLEKSLIFFKHSRCFAKFDHDLTFINKSATAALTFQECLAYFIKKTPVAFDIGQVFGPIVFKHQLE